MYSPLFRPLTWLSLAIAASAGGCAAEEAERRPSFGVHVSNRLPAGCCTPLGDVVAGSTPSERFVSAYDAIREYAASVGANYLVIEEFRASDGEDGTWMRVRGRLFACVPSWDPE
jgi:hypothetical protein